LPRIYFAADAHGSSLVWRKWLTAPTQYKADVLLFCGDLTGKMIVPIIQLEDGTWTTHAFNKVHKFKTREEADKLVESIEKTGWYPYRCSAQEFLELQKNPDKLDKLFKEQMAGRVSSWLKLLLEKVDIKEKTVVCMPGNDDEKIVDEVIQSFESDGIIYPLNKVVEIAKKHEMISLDYVNPTPWKTPRECTEDELKKKIDGLVSKLKNPANAIFNFHCPPYDTYLDLAVKLDKDLKPSRDERVHVGSKAVRDAIDKYQPLLGTHGHIHESFASQEIGRTVVVNPGSEYTEGILRGFIIDLADDKIERYWKVEG
jgi:Icc-related predicted phosphoesterase